MNYGFTRTGPEIESIHNTVTDPSTNQAFTNAIGEIVTPKYTDIVYKTSGGNSAVENMILGIPISTPVGGTCQCENGTIFTRVSNNGDINDFDSLNKIHVGDFGATGNNIAVDTQAISDAFSLGGEVFLPKNYTVNSLSIHGNLSGNGSLVGVVSGSKPTRSDLTSAADSAARKALLEGYYQTRITVTSEISNNFTFENVLFTSLTANSRVILTNCSLQGGQLAANDGGTIVASSLISSDSASAGLFATGNGSISAPSAIAVYPGGRGGQVNNGGCIQIPNCEIWNATQEGIYSLFDGTIVANDGVIDSCGGSGALINYGGSVDVGGATINNNGASGIVSESSGTIFAEGATVTNNAQSGLFAIYGGVIQCRDGVITGNGGFAATSRSSATIDVIGTTIDQTNGSGGVVLQALRSGQILTEEPGTGSKSALDSDDLSPIFNYSGVGGAFIGERDPTFSGSVLGGIVLDSVGNQTISSGEVTLLNSYQKVDTEGGAATDDLDTISSDTIPNIVYLFPVSVRDIVIKHNTGNINCSTGSDITLPSADSGVVLVRAANRWLATPLQ